MRRHESVTRTSTATGARGEGRAGVSLVTALPLAAGAGSGCQDLANRARDFGECFRRLGLPVTRSG
ncbi:MAG: hypothetical protein L0216_08110 [Planctomycetales bacterium]|nr:hypothetical protein [Planctomycetales bacterium]